MATAETDNADTKRHPGLDHLPVRGRDRVQGSGSLIALAYTILQRITLGG
ncbi:MAG TPA: hypothetical protein VMW47_11035 [Verrucomicrobiae bacterium]|nr:hypothetical protein [Verrucomicrobiae bacterium]